MPPERKRKSYQLLMDLVRLGGLLQKTGNEFFRGRGLTQAQFNTLMVLMYTRPMGCRQNELCELLLVKPANVTGLVGRLHERGLVTRKVDSSDERARLVSISAKGRKLIRKVEPDYYGEIDKIMAVLRNPEVKGLSESVAKVQASTIDRGLLSHFGLRKENSGGA